MMGERLGVVGWDLMIPRGGAIAGNVHQILFALGSGRGRYNVYGVLLYS
jgi:hypothetical protein